MPWKHGKLLGLYICMYASIFSKLSLLLNVPYKMTAGLTFENFQPMPWKQGKLFGLCICLYVCVWIFSKIYSLLNVLYKMTVELTFENFYQWADAMEAGQVAWTGCLWVCAYGHERRWYVLHIVLRCVAMCCSVLQGAYGFVHMGMKGDRMCCSLLKFVAGCCSVLGAWQGAYGSVHMSMQQSLRCLNDSPRHSRLKMWHVSAHVCDITRRLDARGETPFFCDVQMTRLDIYE